ncbi:ARM repeat superfamily protein [Forsythia ovata]|uniref:ARM repeat superfamily protein n=1 Tax=Forsythia ovata TaxID=205694 RepID=A0ABD1QPK9_9LAMI
MRNAVGIVDFLAMRKTGLPTGISNVDVLGCSLTILRDTCAGGTEGSKKDISGDVVDMLASSGLIELLISLLRELEPPAILKKTVRLSENQEASSTPSKCCPYKGFRRDVVAIVGNCAYCRKHIQVKIREQDGILLLLQQCVTDEDNPFLREWGIRSVRNILEGNRENKQVVASLELQGSVDVPEMLN